ncbi:MAG: hypothetical protein ACYTBJ_21210 [Planctomycetota bacterium]|jgi:hypothetical protein
MKKSHLIILAFAMAIGLALTAAGSCLAGEQEGKIVTGPSEEEGKVIRWDDERPVPRGARPASVTTDERIKHLLERFRNADPDMAERFEKMRGQDPEAFTSLVKVLLQLRRPTPVTRGRRFEMTDERIEHMMQRLREEDPQKAKDLKRLQAEDPQKFRAELRSMMPRPAASAARGPRPTRARPPRSRRIRRPDDYWEWLKENDPDEAEALLESKQKDRDLYERQLGISWRKYHRVYAESKRNPELAEVLKEDLALKEMRDQLLAAIESTDNAREKKELAAQLEDVVGARFDLLVRKKQIEYEELRKKLEEFQQEVEQREAEVEEWKDREFKQANVRARVEELLGRIHCCRRELPTLTNRPCQSPSASLTGSSEGLKSASDWFAEQSGNKLVELRLKKICDAGGQAAGERTI